ncbi:phage tail assembly chaperone G [Pseudogracilibacillus auburnensis]|uniref:Uncharacterized protein n=1 Tax=Pseudogracilibacillus auburnensis TaxID=1494959 RepID=A0A2V3W6L5_9BACI|nr:hypothetical protein [Pseudogracilibacillus auburnensis]MBO1003735.1 hypothetical protein [Pseudogracilibacillus auburnensis]PXW88824.1 hypothetical protein DFR56_103330 [Pseudogracilibacillus auburnensis]
MHLTLLIDGEDKTFTPGHVSAKFLLKMMEYDQEIDYNDMSVENIKKLAGFVSDVFGKQFTIDEFLEGIKSYELISTFGKVFIFVRTGQEPKKEVDEGNEKGK